MATSNFTAALDGAFLSRSDAAILVPLPTREALREILASTLLALAEKFPGLRELAGSPSVASAAGKAEGMDGRRARKVVFEALSRRLETVLDPARLTGDDLAAAIADAIEAGQAGAGGV